MVPHGNDRGRETRCAIGVALPWRKDQSQSAST
jgi:hypothetical protein